MEKLLQYLWVRLLLSALVVAGAAVVTRFAYDEVVFSSNKSQMEELNRRTLQRAELAIDYAVITLSELSLTGLGNCSEESLMQLHRISYLRGSIKDIQVLGVNNRLLCAGESMARQMGLADFNLDQGYVSYNGAISLHNIGFKNSGLLGVAWQMRPDLTLFAVLNLDSLFFDIFPAPLREQVNASLVLGADDKIASHVPNDMGRFDAKEKVRFSSASERYPLKTSFEIGVPVLRAWNREAENFVSGAGILLGILLGVLSFSVLSRPRDPDAEMRESLKKGEFIPFMQPIFSIPSRKIIGCEVLMRWEKCDGSIVGPLGFIPLAESNGLIVSMTRSIMAQTFVELGEYMLDNPDFKVAFNIVPSDLVSGCCAEELCEIVARAGVARQQVVLELTERQDFEDLGKAVAIIRQLRDLGFKVALDDTGVGHNGLSNVHRLGVDIIKIDKMFIDRVSIDRSAMTIVMMLVKLARELDMRTVAEGIETEEQLKTLFECDVDEGQGYLVSKPLPAGQFLELVRKQDKPYNIKTAA
ncbi:diguanylate cyclase/phosphodiesterase (GGDEF & EAL domains) with PAS/PAC sensor(s) [hydrothermal vent metagenome]|uniref:cyclic-guanylate-specific phosphodiesterase n=1 Tax=hydrothermal vent metagenome TaxID=652676 RepID=A0A3B0UTQ2_9ZZZZ